MVGGVERQALDIVADLLAALWRQGGQFEPVTRPGRCLSWGVEAPQVGCPPPYAASPLRSPVGLGDPNGLPCLEDLGLVPGQELLIGLDGWIVGNADLPSVELVVDAAIRIFVAQSATDREPQVRPDRDVAEVE